MNMKRCVFLFVILTGLSLAAQNNSGEQILMTVGGDAVTVREFENVYKKNPAANTTDQKSLEEYLELFINFKLKVREAKTLGMDTTIGFKNELNGYRKQLSQPYLTDTLITDKLLKEAYDRMQFHLGCSHILIKVDPNALPKDTMAAYLKIMKIRDRIVKGKENFGKLAEQVSEDPYAKGNLGSLGYFTALAGFVYPFESGAYNAKVGEVTMPVRTQFGYHLILVTEKVAHVDIYTSHIMIKLSKTSTKEDSLNAKKKIDEIYEKLKNGADWNELCKQFSDDNGTKSRGGELPALSMSSNFPQEFKAAAMKLGKDGDFSPPFTTRFGWHVVKRNSAKTLPPFADMKNDLKSRVAKDMRSNTGRDALIGKIKNWYGFKESKMNLPELKKMLDSTVFTGKWTSEKCTKMVKPLFILDGKTYTQFDLAKYIETHMVVKNKTDLELFLNTMYKTWVEESLVAYEETKLEQKYPKFKSLMEEYRDGILLFDLTDKKVWSKAVKDTAGLRKYYEANKGKWLWDERADVSTWSCKDAKVAGAVKKLLAKGVSEKDILAKMNKKVKDNVTVTTKIYMKGENATVDANWTPGVTKDQTESGRVVFMNVNKLVKPTPKSLAECKGLVTADYQTHLEKEWLAELKGKYKVEVNKDVLKTIK
ncbi:MAG: peptidylprolyl isomerase [Bacteroidia bacterium]|nr:peptidylprolyl isomerase [Bacteroidia bacterium]